MLYKVYLEITNICNLDCSFCHKTARERRLMSDKEFDILTDRLRGKAKFLYFHLWASRRYTPLCHVSLTSRATRDFCR